MHALGHVLLGWNNVERGLERQRAVVSGAWRNSLSVLEVEHGVLREEKTAGV
jgi:hypothetical protein